MIRHIVLFTYLELGELKPTQPHHWRIISLITILVIFVSGIVHSDEDIFLWCCSWVCRHRAGWKVCLTTVGIEPATFGLLVQLHCWQRSTIFVLLSYIFIWGGEVTSGGRNFPLFRRPSSWLDDCSTMPRLLYHLQSAKSYVYVAVVFHRVSCVNNVNKVKTMIRNILFFQTCHNSCVGKTQLDECGCSEYSYPSNASACDAFNSTIRKKIWRHNFIIV